MKTVTLFGIKHATKGFIGITFMDQNPTHPNESHPDLISFPRTNFWKTKKDVKSYWDNKLQKNKDYEIVPVNVSYSF